MRACEAGQGLPPVSTARHAASAFQGAAFHPRTNHTPPSRGQPLPRALVQMGLRSPTPRSMRAPHGHGCRGKDRMSHRTEKWLHGGEGDRKQRRPGICVETLSGSAPKATPPPGSLTWKDNQRESSCPGSSLRWPVCGVAQTQPREGRPKQSRTQTVPCSRSVSSAGALKRRVGNRTPT